MSEPRARRTGILAYVKEAFLHHWNILLFGGAAVAAAISGVPDVALPLVAAGELAYLGMLSGHPKFRSYVERKDHERLHPVDPKAQEKTEANYAALVAELPKAPSERFTRVRRRCLEMRRLARGAEGRAEASSKDDLQTPALNRMLWVFLKLLHSQAALERFLATTDGAVIEQQLAQLRQRGAAADATTDERVVRSVKDSIATSELRLDNYRKAKNNAELVALELDRIEGKISALAEMAVSHEDPDYITSQVDSVNDSIQETESVMRDMSNLTGFSEESGKLAPAILETANAPETELRSEGEAEAETRQSRVETEDA